MSCSSLKIYILISILSFTAEGHSIHVRNLPYDATVEQLEKEFKKFGSIKRDGIQVRSSKVWFMCYCALPSSIENSLM